DELERRRCVLAENVDLPRLERREHDLAVAELELALHRGPVRGEDLGEDLAEDLLLIEVRGAHDDLALDPGADGIEVLGRDPLAGDVGYGLEIDRDGFVQVRQLFLSEALDDSIEDGRYAGIGIDDRLADDRDDVVGQLEMLVVLEQDEIVGRDGRVRGQQHPDLDLAAGQGLDRQWPSGVEWYEFLEFQAVGLLEPEEAE